MDEEKTIEMLEQLLESVSERFFPLTMAATEELDTFRHIFSDNSRRDELEKILATNGEAWSIHATAIEKDLPEGAHDAALGILMQVAIWTYCKGFTNAQKVSLEAWQVAEEKK